MSEKTIEEFAFEISRRDFIVFAGTGVTYGIPKWKDLIARLSMCLNIFDIDIDKVSEEMYPEIAQNIYERMKNDGHENQYYETIRNALTPTETDYSPQQYDICISTNCVVTTNFENTFQTAYCRKQETINPAINPSPPIIDSLPDFKYEYLLESNRIIYLHGQINEHNIVFKLDDYQNNYPSVSGKPDCPDVLEKYLDYLYKNYTIVFIGFSFKDKYFLNSLININKKIQIADQYYSQKIGYNPKISKIKHYAFLPDVDINNRKYLIENIDSFSKETREYADANRLYEMEKLDNELNSINIEVFRYKQHIDWTRAFELIRSYKRKGPSI